MKYFSKLLSLAFIFLVSANTVFAQHVVIKSSKIPFEDDSVILNIDDYRGSIYWEVSKDKSNWTVIEGNTSSKLHIHVDSSAYYRAVITEGTCDPVYSDTALVAELYDDRDERVYRVVKIGAQYWMAENLDYYIDEGSWYYDDDSISNYLYGRLYSWNVTAGLCPEGWHLPKDDEWKVLELKLGMDTSELDNTGWRGTDQGSQLKPGASSGFDLLYGGYRDEFNAYQMFGLVGAFWTATKYDDDYAWYRGIGTGAQIHRDIYDKQMAFSIRCLKDIPPISTTTGYHSLTRASAVIEGDVISDGGQPVLERGFCWSTSQNPTIDDSYVAAGSGLGEYSGFISFLLPNTTYYVRTYARNNKGTAYGNVISLITPQYSIPTLTTKPLTDIEMSSVITGGALLDDGGRVISDKGVCWSNTANPTTSGLHISEGGGFVDFSTEITGLDTNHTYFVRAYAVNSEGTAYGNEIKFITLPVNPVDTFIDIRDGQSYKMVKIGDQWWMAENLNYYEDPGSWYYNGDSLTNSGYGRLYDWEISQSVCPIEWHLPTDEEWKTLEMAVGMSQAAADATGLRGTDQGTQLKEGEPSGFNVLYGGYRNPAGTYATLGSGATFWTSSENSGTDAWYRGFSTGPQIHRDVFDKDYGFSIRCVRNLYPVVITIPVDSIGKTYARSGGIVTYDGGFPVTEYGVCWSTSPGPTITDNRTSDGSGLGSYISIINGLDPNETYYLRAYATNSIGTAYGDEETFTTITYPVLTTTVPGSITVNSAHSGGTVTDDGGSAVIARGVCWSTSPEPTILDDLTVDGVGTGTFSSIMTGLGINTTYYVRAYATNSKGTGYGDQHEFTTLPTNKIGTLFDSRDGTTYKTVKIGLQWWMAENLNYSVASSWCYNDIGSLCDSLGRLYSWSAAQNSCPDDWHTPSDDEWKILETGLGMSEAEADITGLRGTDQGTQLKKGGSSGFDVLFGGVRDDAGVYLNLNTGGAFWTSSEEAGNIAWYRGFASNPYIHRDTYSKNYGFSMRCVKDTLPVVITNIVDSIGKTYARCGGNVTFDGGIPVTEKGVCYGQTHNPTVSGAHTSDGSGLGSYTSIITGLTANRTYYVRAYATTSVGTGYGEEYSFETVTLPVVVTTPVGSITENTAASGGNVTDGGGVFVSARGVCWSTNTNPSTSDNHTTNGTGTGTFISNVSGLNPNTVYFLRAYATNSKGTGYGEQITFETDPVNETGSFTDTRNGRTYETVKIGDQWWMAENLNYDMANSWCYGGTSEYCDTLGRLYSWSSAVNACPSGWHLPSDYDLQVLEVVLGMELFEASSTGLRGTDQGTQLKKGGSSGFDMLYSGYRTPAGAYATFGTGATIWSSTESGSSAWYRGFGTHPQVHRLEFAKDYGFSVRCLKIELPEVSTATISAKTDSSASGGGEVISDGGAPVTARGVCWSISHDPDIDDDHSVNGSGTGTFISTLTDLSAGTTYYVRAYATNSAGTNYGDEVSFITNIGIPKLNTSPVSDVTDSSAVCGGTITDGGGVPVTARGVCWSTSHDPTAAGDHTTDGAGTGTFISNITGLDPNTQYYVRAYATNSQGTAYGGERSLTTITGVPKVITASVSEITDSSATCGGNVTYNGGESITARGICWSETPGPTTADDHTTDGSGLGTFVSNMMNLDPNTTYYVKAYATNINGTTYGGQETFTTATGLPKLATTAVGSVDDTSAVSGGNITYDGGAMITARGVCWSETPGPTTADDHTTDGSGSGTFISTVTGLDPGTHYYLKAYATNVNGTVYGGQRELTTTSTPPVVTTATPGSVTDSSASGGGNVTSEGGTPVTIRGVCWSTTANPTVADDTTNNGMGAGSFLSFIHGLDPVTEYHVRAYATNTGDTSYGSDEAFTTTFSLDSITDARDNTVYKIVGVGSQWWMAENLTFYVDTGNWFYGDDSATNAEYGRLYNWNTAMAGAASNSSNPSGVQGVCPSGWHIPSDAEWTELTDQLGGLTVAGGKMKETGTAHWAFDADGGATNESGMTALPAGSRLPAGGYQNQTSETTFWSATQSTTTDAWCRRLLYNTEAAGRADYDKAYGFSVRCVKD